MYLHSWIHNWLLSFVMPYIILKLCIQMNMLMFHVLNFKISLHLLCIVIYNLKFLFWNIWINKVLITVCNLSWFDGFAMQMLYRIWNLCIQINRLIIHMYLHSWIYNWLLSFVMPYIILNLCIQMNMLMFHLFNFKISLHFLCIVI